MIEVLSPAKPPTRVEFTCTGCHATLRAGREDAVARIEDHVREDSEVFECPECHKAVWVPLDWFYR